MRITMDLAWSRVSTKPSRPLITSATAATKSAIGTESNWTCCICESISLRVSTVKRFSPRVEPTIRTNFRLKRSPEASREKRETMGASRSSHRVRFLGRSAAWHSGCMKNGGGIYGNDVQISGTHGHDRYRAGNRSAPVALRQATESRHDR